MRLTPSLLETRSSYIAAEVSKIALCLDHVYIRLEQSQFGAFCFVIKTIMTETKLPQLDFVVLSCKPNILSVALGINKMTEYHT